MKRLLYTLLLLLCLMPARAQSVKELEKRRNNTLRQLETTNKMLNETKKDEKVTLNKLNILQKSIEERSRLIRDIGSEITALDLQMDSLDNERTALEAELRRVRDDYARLVRETHRTQLGRSWIMFLLSADDFSQMLRRVRYMQQFSAYRKEQAARIEDLTQEINDKNDALRQNRSAKTDVLQMQQREHSNLARDQRKQQQMLTSLKKKEKDLAAQARKHQQTVNQLNSRIEKLIAEEIRKAEEAKKAKQAKQGKTGTTQKPTTTPSVNTMTKEETLLAGNFEKNKGRLPWPVEKGFVSGKFGVQPHPVLDHVTINNKGIYIQTTSGSTARAVFDGEVTQRFSIPGSNNIVIVKHGNYRTVYANLTDIYVKAGDRVTAKQKIGRIYSDPDNDNKTELYFQVWHEKDILNPSLWLAK